MAGHKGSDIIGVRRDLRANTASKGDSMQDRISLFIPKPTEQELQSEDIKGDLGQRFRTLSVHLYHNPQAVVQHADPFAELQFEFGGLQNVTKNRWSTLS